MKRVLERVLAEVPKERYGIELRLMLQMRYDINSGARERLRNTITQYKQVLANLFKLKAPDFDDINLPIRELEGKTLKTLIMNLKE